MNKRLLIVMWMVLAQTPVAAYAQLPVRPYDVTNYQMGDVWGRESVTEHGLLREDGVVARAAMATAHYRRATAFYLGKFAGQHVMATNYHVQPTGRCSGAVAEFPILGLAVPCTRVFGSWKDIDLALFAVQLSEEDEALLDGLGRNFDFSAHIYPGQKLLTLGFGLASNPGQELRLERDDDCMVFSERNEFHFMADPDAYNPGDYKVWSFAHACDISHGDSGSPVYDRTDGALLGLIWTGTIPKSPAMQSSEHLQRVLKHHEPSIWHELNYAVPAHMIQKHLHDVWMHSEDAEAVQVLRAVLQEN